jgi:plastocyanin
MNVLRNAMITSAALVLGIGAVAHARTTVSSGKPTSYYGQPTSASPRGDNRTGYYGQPNTTSAPITAAAVARATQKQVVAKEVNHRYLFASKTLTIKVGTTLTWLNTSDAAHNVTFDKNKGVNMDFKPSKSVSYRFTRAGTYRYHCEYHPYMTGVVIVK